MVSPIRQGPLIAVLSHACLFTETPASCAAALDDPHPDSVLERPRFALRPNTVSEALRGALVALDVPYVRSDLVRRTVSECTVSRRQVEIDFLDKAIRNLTVSTLFDGARP